MRLERVVEAFRGAVLVLNGAGCTHALLVRERAAKVDDEAAVVVLHLFLEEERHLYAFADREVKK